MFQRFAIDRSQYQLQPSKGQRISASLPDLVNHALKSPTPTLEEMKLFTEEFSRIQFHCRQSRFRLPDLGRRCRRVGGNIQSTKDAGEALDPEPSRFLPSALSTARSEIVEFN